MNGPTGTASPATGVRPPDELLSGALRLAARRYGTPAYVTDLATLAGSAGEVRAAFPDPWLRAFSVKANDVVSIVGRIAALGFDANAVSAGEWAIARRAGIPNERITLEGVGKTDVELRAALLSAADGNPIRWLSVESLDEVRSLVALARAHVPRRPEGRALDVLFRLNPEVVPETHRGLAVGSAASKFGMTASEVSEAVELVGEVPRLVARGVHLHVGSQLQAVDAWRDAVRRGLALLALIRGTRRSFDTLDVGGGFAVVPRGEVAPGPERFAREVPALIEAIPGDRRPERLAIEPGRAIVARAGFLIGRVLHVRDRGGRQIVLDVGMTELIRPALYDAWHEIDALTSFGRPVDLPAADGSEPPLALEPARVEGPICESTDHLGEHLLPPLGRGDLVAIRDAGAYATSLSSTYNGRPRPPQILIEVDGRLALARRRGRTGDLG